MTDAPKKEDPYSLMMPARCIGKPPQAAGIREGIRQLLGTVSQVGFPSPCWSSKYMLTYFGVPSCVHFKMKLPKELKLSALLGSQFSRLFAVIHLL